MHRMHTAGSVCVCVCVCVCTRGLAYPLAFLQLSLSLLFLPLSLPSPMDLPDDTQEVTYRTSSDAKGKGCVSTAGIGGRVWADTHPLLSSVLPAVLQSVQIGRAHV